MEPNYNPYENTPEGGQQENYNPYNNQSFRRPDIKRTNLFETLSMVLGIAALVSCTCFYGSYILGALAILFALLSRGGQMKMSSKAKLGLIVGIAAIILSTVMTISAVYIAIEEYGSIENYLREYCDMLGLDFEQEFGTLFE